MIRAGKVRLLLENTANCHLPHRDIYELRLSCGRGYSFQPFKSVSNGVKRLQVLGFLAIIAPPF